jgi:hypothetical protein
MRIGLVTPRINGLSIAGLGNPAAPNLLGQAQMYFNSFMVGLTEPGAATPDVVAETLTQAAQDACAAAAPTPCDASSIASQISSLVAQYTSAYNAAHGNSSLYWPGNQSVQSPGWVAPVAPPPVAPIVPASIPIVSKTAQMQYSSQPSNALDRVTPQASNVRGPTQVSNALTPPLTPAPVVSTNAGSFTGTGTTANPAGGTQSGAASTSFFDQTISIGSVNVPTWLMVAGAGVGLLMMMKGK